MSIEDQPTQQIRRPAAPTPMPGPLNPAENGSTEVLSLDDLLDGPATPVPPAPVAPAPVAPAPVAPTPTPPAAAPAAPRIGAVPVGSGQTSTPGTSSRLRGDAAAAWRGGLDRSRTWITNGDNAVIAATAVVALLLLLVVALV